MIGVPDVTPAGTPLRVEPEKEVAWPDTSFS